MSIFPLERLGLGPEAAGHLSKVTECPAQESPRSAREPHSHGRIWAQRWLGKVWSTRELSVLLLSLGSLFAVRRASVSLCPLVLHKIYNKVKVGFLSFILYSWVISAPSSKGSLTQHLALDCGVWVTLVQEGHCWCKPGSEPKD